MKQWVLDNFDKVILLLLIASFVWTAVHGNAYSQRTNDLLIGALLGLITGKATAGMGDPPTPPTGGPTP